MAQVGFVLPDELYNTESTPVAWARRAEAAGFDSVWKGESTGSNGLLWLAAAAQATSSVHLGTGVASVFARTPALIAMSAATLKDISDGRALLGLGTSSDTLVERFHGQGYDNVLRRLRETIEIVHGSTADGVVDYDGAIFDLGEYPSSYLQEGADVPIYNSALGEVNRRLTGEFADGWIPVMASLDTLASDVAEIRTAADEAGRDPDSIDVAPWIPTAVDDDPAMAEQRVRELISQELAMGYTRVFERYGYGDAASRAFDLWRDGDRDAAAKALPTDAVDSVALYGTPETVRTKLRRFVDAGATHPVLWGSFTATDDEFQAIADAVSPADYDY